MIIAVDFDGTIVCDCYPEIGKERTFAIETLKALIHEGHQLILWSVREGPLLQEAVEWCRERGVEFYAVNEDYPGQAKDDKFYTRKLKVDLFIDDRNIGGMPNWGIIYQMLMEHKSLEQIMMEQLGHEPHEHKKKPWWKL